MKSVGAQLEAHKQQEVTTLALLFLVTRRDGEVFAFTSHDRELEYLGRTYSPLNAFDYSSVVTSAGLNVDNLDVLGLIDADEVTEADLRAGRYRYAQFTIRRVNWADLAMGHETVRAGTLGEITVNRSGSFTAEARGAMQPLQQTIGRLVTKRCPWRLGGTECGFNLASRTQSGSVATVASRALFTVTGISDDVFNGGLLHWTTGANAGQEMEVKQWSVSPDTVELELPMEFDVAAADAFTLAVGCDHTRATCIAEFNNIANYGGFPDAPGRDAVLQYPNATG